MAEQNPASDAQMEPFTTEFRQVTEYQQADQVLLAQSCHVSLQGNREPHFDPSMKTQFNGFQRTSYMSLQPQGQRAGLRATANRHAMLLNGLTSWHPDPNNPRSSQNGIA